MKVLPRELSGLEKTIDYKFNDVSLLETAMTHSSYSNEKKVKNIQCSCNERLEFLGDSVLSIITSEYLFEKFKDRDEGVLSKMRSKLVCASALAKYAGKIGIGDYLLLGVGEEKNHGRENKSILHAAFEALSAAMYLDSGANGHDAVKEFLLPFIVSELEMLEKSGQDEDYKTRLQEFLQQDGAARLTYAVTSESGPDHAKIFEVEARMESNIIGHGVGRTKQDAEQNAAKEALMLFGQ